MSDLANGLQVVGSQVEFFGRTLVERLGTLNVMTAALLGGALVLDRALSRRVRASWRVALYAPVALRVLLPLDWSLRVAHAPSVVTLLGPLSVVGLPSSEAPPPSVVSWYALVAVAYFAVMAALVVRAVRARVTLARALASAQPVTAPRAGALCPVPCPVLEHEDLGPMAVGILAPRIVLPRRLLAASEENALACVLRHESAHLRRGDAWLSVAMEILSIVAWPVVPVWIAVGRVRQLVELACDEAALAGADATERRRYGHALLDIAEWRPLIVAPLGAGELHFGLTLRARIEALASQRHWPIAAQGIALSTASIALLVACAGSAPPTATTGGLATAPDGDTAYGYLFDADTAKAAAGAPAASAPTLNGDGRVSPEIIQTTVRSHFGALKACYDAGLKKNAKLAGTVTVKTLIGADGVPTEATDSSSTLPDAAVVECVAGEFRKMSFPKGPGLLTVEYPIQFSPQ